MDLVPKTDQQTPAKCGEVSIKIEASFKDSEISLQLKDGKYHCVLDGQLHPLATTLFEMFPDKARKLLKIGGSVMVMCYALYNMGFNAYNFKPGTLSFTVGFDDDGKMASVRLNVESGKFLETLWKEWKRIVVEHKQELGHLQKAFPEAPGNSVASSGNVNVGQSERMATQRDHGQMAMGDFQSINNPTGPITFNRN